MIVWNGGKLKSHKIQDLCLMLNSTLHKSFLSTLLIIHRRCTFISAIPIGWLLNYTKIQWAQWPWPRKINISSEAELQKSAGITREEGLPYRRGQWGRSSGQQ
jgi:hypothetical protein